MGRNPSDTTFLAVARIAAIVTLDGAVVSPGRLHGNPTTRDQGGVVRTGKAVDVQSIHHAPNICQVKIPPLVAISCADPLVLGRNGLKNDVLVPLVRHWLAHVLQTLAKAIHGVQKIVGIIAWFYFSTVQLFVVRPSSLLGVAVVLLFQGIPCCLSVTDTILPGLAHVLFYYVVGRTLRGEEQGAEDVLVRALPRCHGRRILCGWRLRIALENGGDALSMERQDDAKLVLVINKMHPIFAVKMWAELQYCLDVVGIMLRHDVAPVGAVVIGNMPYSPSGRNALCVVRDAHRCRAVVVEGYVPYSRSSRNALCVVQDAHRCNAVVVKVAYPTLVQAAMHCV